VSVTGEKTEAVEAEAHAGSFLDSLGLTFPRRRRLADRMAGLMVRAGGIGVIGSILAILIFIAVEVWPLTDGASVVPEGELEIPGKVLELASDPYRTHIAALSAEGVIRVIRLRDRKTVLSEKVTGAEVPGSAVVAARAAPDGSHLSAMTASGAVVVAYLDWQVRFDEQQRRVVPAIAAVSTIEVEAGFVRQAPFALRVGAGGDRTTLASLRGDAGIEVVRSDREVNDFTGEVVESNRTLVGEAVPGLSQLVLDERGDTLYGGTLNGDLVVWELGGEVGRPVEVVSSGGGAVTALEMLLGGRSLLVGQEDGSLSVWFRAPRPDGPARLVRVRDFAPHDAALRFLVPSERDKGFLAVDGEGGIGLYHSTSHRTLWRGRASGEAYSAVSFASKGDGALFAGEGRISSLAIDNPHPDVSFRSLFGRVWYEGYERPEYVWQSSSATDDFEPKYSILPLLIGTLKGTFYSMLLAIPLGVFGAMYVSQFMHPKLKGAVKPVVEIMAALPSVVLGFLAGLWLAPRVERAFPALLLMLLLFPLLVLGAGAIWQRVPARWRNRVPSGSEVFVFVAVLALGAWFSLVMSAPVEGALFGGSFQTWLRETSGLDYDQRNAIIVGLAMGFAVIPIVFAISEDAFSNVPRNLVSGSLALGANRWQTVTRVVLPTASPGIFSAVMVGFGRAVGETMIVLMATGNTPIRDWSPFNGFRTLSANIAVEIPEAPQFSTLYRILFLSALLLFVLTFVLNTAAEMVRQRLRKKYASL
jgi:phosphate transport system permease protein